MLNMQLALHLVTALLLSFAVLGSIDGFYLHLWRFKLHAHPESRTEHLLHTARGFLFAGMLWFLYYSPSVEAFYIGAGLAVLDILILGMDAFVEGDSRRFMGGLPRWEYILHLFVNGFHFAGIAVFLLVKLQYDGAGIRIMHDLDAVPGYRSFARIVLSLIPGAIGITILNLLLLHPRLSRAWAVLTGKFPPRRPEAQQ